MRAVQHTTWETCDSPIGELLLLASEAGLAALFTPESRGYPVAPSGTRGGSPALREAQQQLRAYFAGKLTQFSVPLAPQGTPFQQRVWAALQSIPCGTRTTYGALARQIGEPTAVRAVGHANGHNPISIIIPCHRVVGHDGKLTGYGGGLWRKEWLLEHEAKMFNSLSQAALRLS